jgi:hypothetical protein
LVFIGEKNYTPKFRVLQWRPKGQRWPHVEVRSGPRGQRHLPGEADVVAAVKGGDSYIDDNREVIVITMLDDVGIMDLSIEREYMRRQHNCQVLRTFVFRNIISSRV